MQYINKPLRTRALGNKMKDEAVHDVFKQGPEKHAAQEYEHQVSKGIIQLCIAAKQHINDNGDVDTPDNKGMCFGEHFQVLALEYARLSLIVYFLKLHVRSILSAQR
jgi:hypothetical protein